MKSNDFELSTTSKENSQVFSLYFTTTTTTTTNAEDADKDALMYCVNRDILIKCIFPLLTNVDMILLSLTCKYFLKEKYFFLSITPMFMKSRRNHPMVKNKSLNICGICTPNCVSWNSNMKPINCYHCL